MESTLYHSNIYSTTGAPSPYIASSFAEQHQLPPLPQYRHHNNMFGTRSPYISSPYHHPYNGHGADIATSPGGPDSYAPSWSSSSFMSSPTSLPLPPNSFRGRYPPPHSSSGYPNASCTSPDTGSLTGAAPIQRPKLTTTVWEDEGTLCYQVDAKNICVARRQDNDMVNGTKLLNVVGMSRGKRDGILKNEKGRVVVKVGAMHLKGVWITFSRGKDLATKFKILDLLYPLFTDDPSMFLCTSSSANSNNGSTTSTSSNNSNGVPVTSDTASVETAQSSSTVKSLVHHHNTSNVPPMMAYKTDNYNMLPSWMDQRSYQQSLPSINNNNNDSNVYRSQNCSPVPSTVASVCGADDPYGMFSQPEYDYRSTLGRTFAEQNEFSSSAYDSNTFLSHKPDMFGDESAITTSPHTTTYSSSLPSDKSYGLEELPIPQQPTSIYNPRHQHGLEHVVNSPDDENDSSDFTATATVLSEDGSTIVPESVVVDYSRKRKMDDTQEYSSQNNCTKKLNNPIRHPAKRIKN